MKNFAESCGQVILFFTPISFGHALSGRTEALVRIISKRGFKTAFVEIPCSLIGFLRSLLPQRQKVWEFLLPKVRVIENIIVIPSLPLLPFGRLKWIRNINKIIIALWLRNILSKMPHKIAIISTPGWYPVMKYLNIEEIYYDCIDDIPAFCVPREIELYKKWEEKLVIISDAVFPINPSIKEHILNICPKKEVLLLRDGVNAEWFEKQAENLLLPEDIAQIKRPIVGYVGGISSRVDLELIAYCAKCLKDWSFVLVGPVTSLGVDKPLQEIPNVYLLGLKPYKHIPCYIKVFDVCLIPFKLDEWGNYSDPLKLYEYFSIGKPVVSTNISIMKELGELVYVGENKDNFVERIKEAYEKKDTGIQKRIDYAEENSWDKKVDELLTYLDMR